MTPKELFKSKVVMITTKLLKELPFEEDDCFAVLGNLGHESAGFSKLQEIKPTVKGSRGGYGWAQWTGPRRVAYENYCKAEGLDPASDEANLGFLVFELKTTERTAVTATFAAKTLQDKVVSFEKSYERAGVKHYASRIEWAMIAAETWRNQRGVPSTAPKEETWMDKLIPVFVTPIIRHGLTMLSGILVTMGMLDPAQQGNFTAILMGILVGIAGLGASFMSNAKQEKK